MHVDSSSELIKYAACFFKATIMAENKHIQCKIVSIIYTYLFHIAGDDVTCSYRHILRDLPPHRVCVCVCVCALSESVPTTV